MRQVPHRYYAALDTFICAPHRYLRGTRHIYCVTRLPITVPLSVLIMTTHHYIHIQNLRKLQVSLAEYCLFYGALLQKRPIFLSAQIENLQLWQSATHTSTYTDETICAHTHIIHMQLLLTYT